jgi:hypothetical protein
MRTKTASVARNEQCLLHVPGYRISSLSVDDIIVVIVLRLASLGLQYGLGRPALTFSRQLLHSKLTCLCLIISVYNYIPAEVF